MKTGRVNSVALTIKSVGFFHPALHFSRDSLDILCASSAASSDIANPNIEPLFHKLFGWMKIFIRCPAKRLGREVFPAVGISNQRYEFPDLLLTDALQQRSGRARSNTIDSASNQLSRIGSVVASQNRLLEITPIRYGLSVGLARERKPSLGI